MRRAVRASREHIHCITDRVDDIDILALGIAADILSLAHPSSFQNERQCLRMIINEQPVTNVEPAAVNWHCLARESLDDRQRDELFRKLMRSIIVRAIGEQDRESVGMTPCPDQMVRRGLAGRIGRAWIVPGFLRESSVVLQRPINLIRGDMKEPKSLRARAKPAPMRECDLEQHIGADHIGIDELGRTVNRPVDVALRRQMHHRVGIETRKNVSDGTTIAGAAEAIAGDAFGRKQGRPNYRRKLTYRRQVPRDPCER
jgi:hypothetical protein